MHRLRSILATLMALTLASAMFAGNALAISSRLTLEQVQAAGWDCTPLVLIGGHYHCSPPGRPSVMDIVVGTADTPSIVHSVFREDGTCAGTELLIRADLFAGQPCPTDMWLPVPPWLPEPVYWACHHFQFST